MHRIKAMHGRVQSLNQLNFCVASFTEREMDIIVSLRINADI